MAVWYRLTKEQKRILQIVIDGGEIEESKGVHDSQYCYLTDEFGKTEVIIRKSFQKLVDYELIKKKDDGKWR